MSKISFIIPAYKSANFIEECLYSIQHQDYFTNNKDYEILIGVDCCQETQDKLEQLKYRYSNIKVFTTQRNVGPYIIRNSLVEQSNGEYLFFFDADDIWLKDGVSRIMKSFKNPRIDVVRYKMEHFRVKNNNNEIVKVRRSYLSMGQFCITRKAFDKIGGFQGWLCAADREFYVRSRKHSLSTSSQPNPIYLKRLHDDALTTIFDARKGRSLLRESYKQQMLKNTYDWSIPIVPVKIELDFLFKSEDIIETENTVVESDVQDVLAPHNKIESQSTEAIAKKKFEEESIRKVLTKIDENPLQFADSQKFDFLQIWLGDSVPDYIQRFMDSIRDVSKSYKLITDHPTKEYHIDFNDYIQHMFKENESYEYFYKKIRSGLKGYSAKSNLVRFHYLSKHPHIFYLDSDAVLNKVPQFDRKYIQLTKTYRVEGPILDFYGIYNSDNLEFFQSVLNDGMAYQLKRIQALDRDSIGRGWIWAVLWDKYKQLKYKDKINIIDYDTIEHVEFHHTHVIRKTPLKRLPTLDQFDKPTLYNNSIPRLLLKDSKLKYFTKWY